MEEEQRWERAKAFLHQYRRPLLISGLVVVVGIAAVFGYQNYREGRRLQASKHYWEASQALEKGRTTAAKDGFQTVYERFPDTAYAGFARAFQARLLYKDGNYTEALKTIRPVARGEMGPQVARHLAVEIEARILWDQGKVQAALEALDRLEAPFLPTYYLLQGDLLAAAGKPKPAQQAYQKVLQKQAAGSLQEMVNRRLQRLPGEASASPSDGKAE